MDIIKLPIEHKAESIDSRFRLVLMAAQRARQISEGSNPMVKVRYVKNTSIALEEAIDDKLKYLTGDEARKAKEYEFRLRRERMAKKSMEENAAASIERMEDIKTSYKNEAAEIETWEDEELGELEPGLDSDEVLDNETEDDF